MDILIRSAKIVDSGSSLNGRATDIHIKNGVISAIKSGITAAKDTQVIEANGLCVSPGWFDMQVNFRDPGLEYKEDLVSGPEAAARGGFTGVAVMPSTSPPLHSKAEIEYVKNKTKGMLTDVYPVGALSRKLEGKDLSEMYDMFLSGAVAFSDDKNAVADAGLLTRALLYAKNFKGLVITHCDDKSISLDGKMNEGPVSTGLGLKGIPALAEEVMVARNIFLAEYTGARIHFSSISAKGSVELIREAKKRKLAVTAAVNAHHLALDDSHLKGFETNYKVSPPLRTRADINALLIALADGTIDVITSDHSPEDTETKVTEFDHAAFGMTGLETAFALANMNKGKMKLDQLIQKLSTNPRKLLGLPAIKIKAGEKANLTLFDPGVSWTLTEKDVHSKSKNTPFIGTRLKGKAVGVVNNGKLILNG
jgi:dihydroorotase